MAKSTSTTLGSNTVELATFYIGDALCGMDILNIQEINKHMDITNVPQAPQYVKGILNLRGQIVTVIDLGSKLGLTSTRINGKTRNIIVASKDEHIGLLVEKLGDVVETSLDQVEPAPANIGGVQGKFFKGVFKTENSLIGILDVEEVLKEDQ